MKKLMFQLLIMLFIFSQISTVMAAGNSEVYKFPSAWKWNDAPIKTFTDGTNITTNFDVSSFKNKGVKKIYVSVRGLATNNGLSEKKPVNSLLKAYQLASDNDTIICLDGNYKRSALFQDQKIEKNINIVAKNSGKVRFFNADDHVFSKTKGYSYVYQTSRTKANKVIALLGNVEKELIQVKDIKTVDATKGGWYTEGKTVYIHMPDNKAPNNSNAAILLNGQSQIYVASANKNVSLYLEGIHIYGGATGNVFFANSQKFTKPKLYMKNVVARYARGDAISVIGAEYAFMQNVEASFAQKDGFNYHASHGTSPKAIEVNVVARGNGDNSIKGAENTNNGSTMHDGGKIIRIGGKYFENMGGNVADVHIGTQSICINCEAYNSKDTSKTMYNSDFTTQQADAEMWLINCKAYGSVNNLAYSTGTTMHVKNTEYTTKVGGGNFIVED